LSSSKRSKIYLILASGVLVAHVVVAALAKPSFTLTIFGDSLPCALLLIAMLACLENFRPKSGALPLFWRLTTAGLFFLCASQVYWFYFDSLKRYSTPSPVVGDSLFLFAHVFFLAALALRPHSASGGRDLRIRRLDFALLTLWWFALYGYVALPWQWVIQNFAKYDPAYYSLALIQHLAIIGALCILWAHNRGTWRRFYGHMIFAFVLIAAANLLLNVAIDRGVYYAGGFFDTPFLVAVYWFTVIANLGPTLEPLEDSTPNRELKQTLWTARVAMMAILSLPVIALTGYFEKGVPLAIAAFRLRLVFGAIFVLGALVFRKLNVLARELVRSVNLSHGSIENLKSVQAQVTQSQKFAALGRLAAGAAHEISNPLTAILGYSELLADIPLLSPEDHANARAIQVQVRRAQTAVNSLRNTLRTPSTPFPTPADKNPAS
jgi:signal transduction histidine kinase